MTHIGIALTVVKQHGSHIMILVKRACVIEEQLQVKLLVVTLLPAGHIICPVGIDVVGINRVITRSRVVVIRRIALTAHAADILVDRGISHTCGSRQTLGNPVETPVETEQNVVVVTAVTVITFVGQACGKHCLLTLRIIKIGG